MLGYIAFFLIFLAAVKVWKDADEGGYLLNAVMTVAGVILMIYGGINRSGIQVGIGAALCFGSLALAR